GAGIVSVVWAQPKNDTTFYTDDPVYKQALLSDSATVALTFTDDASNATFFYSTYNAHALIDDSDVKTFSALLSEYKLPANSSVNWVANRNVYQLSRVRDDDGFNDFKQSYLAMPEYLQSDIIHLMYPTYNRTWNPIWARNVYNNDGYTKYSYTDCPNNNTASAFTDTFPAVTCPSTSAPSSAPASSSTSAPASGSSSTAAPSSATRTSTSTASSSATSQSGSGDVTGSQPSGSGSSVGITVGVILGCLVAAFVGAFAYLWNRRSRRPDYIARRQRVFGQASASAGSSAVMVGEDGIPAEAGAGTWVQMQDADGQGRDGEGQEE
ncbi:hypothetical protein HDU93_004916, partial [Gonapodya sp. JEL0774]